jgi:hypothetical protein
MRGGITRSFPPAAGIIGPSADDLKLGQRIWINITIPVKTTDTILEVKLQVARHASVAQLLRSRGRQAQDMRMLRAGGEELDNDSVRRTVLRIHLFATRFPCGLDSNCSGYRFYLVGRLHAALARRCLKTA